MIALGNDNWTNKLITDESNNKFIEYFGRAFVIDNQFNLREI